jgi:hypothetical protein
MKVLRWENGGDTSWVPATERDNQMVQRACAQDRSYGYEPAHRRTANTPSWEPRQTCLEQTVPEEKESGECSEAGSGVARGRRDRSPARTGCGAPRETIPSPRPHPRPSPRRTPAPRRPPARPRPAVLLEHPPQPLLQPAHPTLARDDFITPTPAHPYSRQKRHSTPPPAPRKETARAQNVHETNSASSQ